MFDKADKRLTMKKKFNIEEDTQTFDIEIQEFPNEILTQTEIKYDSTLLLIKNNAFNEISDHIQWGNLNTDSNIREQGGLLIGRVYDDDKRNIRYGVVEKILFSNPTSSSSASLEMGHITWQNMLREYDNHRIENSKNHIIGWYHTHPNNLDVFMSGVDMNTQRNFFNKDWHFAMVLNPHKQIWKVFNGKKAIECLGIVYNEEYEVLLNSKIVKTKNIYIGNKDYEEHEYKENEEIKYLFSKQTISILIIGTILLFLFVVVYNKETTYTDDKNKSNKYFIESNYVEVTNLENNFSENNTTPKTNIKNKNTVCLEETNSSENNTTVSNFSSRITDSNESNNSKLVLTDNLTIFIKDNKIYIKEGIYSISQRQANLSNKTEFYIKLKNIPFFIDLNKKDCESTYSKFKCYVISQ